MSPALAQREIVLAAVALLAIVVALVVASRDGDSSAAAPELPEAVPAPVEGGWYEALAAPYRVDADAPTTACGHRADDATQGVAHPVLPCGTKLYVRYGDVEVLTEVVDRGTGAPGRVFDVTRPLARRLGLGGIDTIRWRFAR